MPDGVYPVRNRMQPAHRDAVLDSAYAQPDIHKLPPLDNSVLFLREPCYLRFNPPSPSRPTYIGGEDGLGGHARMVLPPTSRVVRGV